MKRGYHQAVDWGNWGCDTGRTVVGSPANRCSERAGYAGRRRVEYTGRNGLSYGQPYGVWTQRDTAMTGTSRHDGWLGHDG